MTDGSMDNNAHYDQRDWEIHGNVTNKNYKQYLTELPQDSIPDVAKIMPYLADRESQAVSLKERVIKILQSDMQRIIICVLPGAENEIHEGFMQRYDKAILPDIIKQYDKNCPNHQMYMSWPNKKVTIEASLSRLKSELLKRISSSSTANANDIPTELASINNHLSLRYNISYTNWNKSEQTLIDKWIDYLVKFPPLKNNKLITVFVCLHYEPESEYGMMHKLFGISKTSSMRKYVTKASQKQNSNIIYLDELRPLTHQHLHDWAFNICPCIDSEINAGLLQAQAIKLCQGKKEIPLGDILEDMHKAIKSAYYRK